MDDDCVGTEGVVGFAADCGGWVMTVAWGGGIGRDGVAMGVGTGRDGVDMGVGMEIGARA